MTSFMTLDGITSFLRLKDVTITCKDMRRSLRIGGSSSVQWRKVGRSWRLRMCFRRLLCVRFEIDQLQCVNCWVIIHCLSVSCTTINHSRCTLVIWSSLQLISKQWIITQQFTAGADLFLNSNTPRLYSQWLNLVIYWLINHCTDWARTGVTSFGRQFDFHDVIYHNRRRNVNFTTIGRSKRT